MCLIGLAINAHPDYPVILVSNRDEYYKRPTAPLTEWQEHPELMGGQDLKMGGSWLMLKANGDWAALTNVRDLSLIRQQAPSRGELVLNWLTSSDSLKDRMQHVLTHKDRYSGFNLLVGNRNQAWHLSSYDKEWRSVPTGIHALSNATLNSNWPKMRHTQNRLLQTLTSRTIPEHDQLRAVTGSTAVYPSRLRPNTGIPGMMEKMLSAPFIVSPLYGTVSQSTILLGQTHWQFSETTFTYKGREKGTVGLEGKYR